MKNRKVILVVIAILLIAVVFTSGCSNTQKIEEALEGEWYQEEIIGALFVSNSITFGNNRSYVLHSEFYSLNGHSNEITLGGTYEIIDDEIILTNTDGEIQTIIRYTYEDENLQLVVIGADRNTEYTLTKEE